MTDSKTVVVATTNEHKLAEIAATLEPFGYTVISRAAAGVPEFEIEETGDTFEENSLLKARAIFDRLEGRAATIADDSGIEVDALKGAPGVYSARFAVKPDDAADYKAAERNTGQAHRSLQDRVNNAKLLRLLEGTPMERRTARYVAVITCLRPGMEPLVSRGEIEGHVDFTENGKAGFGYDPLFIPEGYDHSFALFDPVDKNAISHRGLALKALAEKIAAEKGKV